MEAIHVLLTEIGAEADSSCEHTQVLVIEQVPMHTRSGEDLYSLIVHRVEF